MTDDSDARWIRALTAKGHRPILKDDGSLDIFAHDFEYHNGPGCEACCENWCMLCISDPEASDEIDICDESELARPPAVPDCARVLIAETDTRFPWDSGENIVTFECESSGTLGRIWLSTGVKAIEGQLDRHGGWLKVHVGSPREGEPNLMHRHDGLDGVFVPTGNWVVYWRATEPPSADI